jgi:hypothetical protein
VTDRNSTQISSVRRGQAGEGGLVSPRSLRARLAPLQRWRVAPFVGMLVIGGPAADAMQSRTPGIGGPTEPLTDCQRVPRSSRQGPLDWRPDGCGIRGAAHGWFQAPVREHSVLLPDGKTVLEAGWQLVLAAAASCVYIVPEKWPVSQDGRKAVAPDLAISVQLSATRDSWSAHRARVRSYMQPAVVHQDGSDRLWLEQSDGRRTWHHVSVSNGTDVCAVDLEVRGEPAADLVRRIASSVRVATDADRAWLKR